MNLKTMIRKANVLAVDDQRANLVALEAVLATDYNLILAGSGFEAIDILRERHDIDLILMDLQMPGMDGFETASKIKHMQGCQDIPVVFITAVFNEDPYIKQGYKVGAVDYFSKPFDPEILKVKVGIYASFRQRADILRERERQIQASEELRQVGRELSTMLKSLRVGVIVADASGRVCQTNEEVFSICKSHDPVGDEFNGEMQGWWDAQGRVVEGRLGPLERALHSGESSHNEFLDVPCHDGVVKTILCSASPLRGLDGKIAGAVLVIQDLTERKRLEKDLERRIAKLVSPDVELQSGN